MLAARSPALQASAYFRSLVTAQKKPILRPAASKSVRCRSLLSTEILSCAQPKPAVSIIVTVISLNQNSSHLRLFQNVIPDRIASRNYPLVIPAERPMQVEYQSSPLSPPECSSAMFQAPLLGGRCYEALRRRRSLSTSF